MNPWSSLGTAVLQGHKPVSAFSCEEHDGSNYPAAHYYTILTKVEVLYMIIHKSKAFSHQNMPKKKNWCVSPSPKQQWVVVLKTIFLVFFCSIEKENTSMNNFAAQKCWRAAVTGFQEYICCSVQLFESVLECQHKETLNLFNWKLCDL